jgi:hypothetical protein
MVSDVALHNRATMDARPERSVEQLFAFYRAELESLAAAQYAQG